MTGMVLILTPGSVACLLLQMGSHRDSLRVLLEGPPLKGNSARKISSTCFSAVVAVWVEVHLVAQVMTHDKCILKFTKAHLHIIFE